MSLKMAVCDDDVIICRQMSELLQERDRDYTIDVYVSGKELIESQKEYDVIFLDIEMEPIDGIETAKILRNKRRKDYIIFLTSHTDYMPEAFKVQAFRFLQKPIQIQQFTEAITEAEKDILEDEKFVVSSDEGMVLINQKDIVYIEALGDGSCLHTEKETYVIKKYLKQWEAILDSSRFFKIHKSYLLGLRYVKVMNESNVELNVDDISLPVARRRRKAFENNYIEYVKKYGRNI